MGRTLPEDFKLWLLHVGFGDVGEELGFRKEFFAPVTEGELKGGVQFAQDILGNFYAFPPVGECVFFLSRSEPTCAVLASSFRGFLSELERHEYNITQWVDSVERSPYAWSAA